MPASARPPARPQPGPPPLRRGSGGGAKLQGLLAGLLQPALAPRRMAQPAAAGRGVGLCPQPSPPGQLLCAALPAQKRWSGGQACQAHGSAALLFPPPYTHTHLAARPSPRSPCLPPAAQRLTERVNVGVMMAGQGRVQDVFAATDSFLKERRRMKEARASAKRAYTPAQEEARRKGAQVGGRLGLHAGHRLGEGGEGRVGLGAGTALRAMAGGRRGALAAGCCRVVARGVPAQRC
jgi:hypothetical protein